MRYSNSENNDFLNNKDFEILAAITHMVITYVNYT